MDVPIILVAVGAAILVALVATLTPVHEHHGEPVVPELTASWSGRLSRAQWMARAAFLALVALATVAGRAGADDELDNLAPALVLGAGLPVVALGCLLVPRLWRWLDPWDTLARVLTPRDTSEPPGHVWPAVVVALPGLWLLAVNPRPLDPRAVGTALAAYTIVAVAGCLALGRARWLSSAEPVGILLAWLGLVPRRALARWAPPRGAEVLLGVVIGGLLFGLVRRTEVWVPVLSSARPTLWSTLGLLAAFVVGAALVRVVARIGDRGSVLVARALVPIVAGVLLAFALARDRLFTSVQLLPGLFGDPLGRGWDLWGAPTDGLVLAPLGAVGLVTVQLLVLIALHLVSAVITPRPYVGDDRLPAITVLALSVVAGVVAVSLH